MVVIAPLCMVYWNGHAARRSLKVLVTVAALYCVADTRDSK
jgi:hypothetical protein